TNTDLGETPSVWRPVVDVPSLYCVCPIPEARLDDDDGSVSLQRDFARVLIAFVVTIRGNKSDDIPVALLNTTVAPRAYETAMFSRILPLFCIKIDFVLRVCDQQASRINCHISEMLPIVIILASLHHDEMRECLNQLITVV